MLLYTNDNLSQNWREFSKNDPLKTISDDDSLALSGVEVASHAGVDGTLWFAVALGTPDDGVVAKGVFLAL